MAKIKKFIIFLYNDWWSLMSGGLSIPFTLFGVESANNHKDAFYLLAIISLAIVCYRTWSRCNKESPLSDLNILFLKTQDLCRRTITNQLSFDSYVIEFNYFYEEAKASLKNKISDAEINVLLQHDGTSLDCCPHFNKEHNTILSYLHYFKIRLGHIIIQYSIR